MEFTWPWNSTTLRVSEIRNVTWHIIQQQRRLANIFNQPSIVSYRKEKSLKSVLVRAKVSFDRAAIIKTCKQRSNFKRFDFKPEGNLSMTFCFSACNTPSSRSRISYRNSTEQTKLAPDHLLTAPSFSLGTFQLIIYSQSRSWGLVDLVKHYNASFRCFSDRVKTSITHLMLYRSRIFVIMHIYGSLIFE